MMYMGNPSIYVAAAPQTTVRLEAEQNDDEGPALRTLARMAMTGSISGLQDAESALVSYASTDPATHDGDSPAQDAAATIQRLERRGYIRDGTKWLTRRGFDAVGRVLLKDIMRDLGSDGAGEHHITHYGPGEVLTDSTRPYEPGYDISAINVAGTLLNSFIRTKSGPPLDIAPQDIEQHVTEADTKVAVAYCLDLSSTMRSKLRDGMSRIEAAKRTLWALYTLNSRHYSGDSIHMIGFASMAHIIRPYDIPYLETFTANDDFLHYTNYQAALRLAMRTLRGDATKNRRIVFITDGQPSACFVEERQRQDILLEKPYSSFYAPNPSILSKIEDERGTRLDASGAKQVYLCYKYRGVDQRISTITSSEAKRCQRSGIHLDYVVISDEEELVKYIQELAVETKSRMYWAQDGKMTAMLIYGLVRN